MQLGPGPARPLKFHLMSRELILLLDITQTHMHAHTCSEFIRNILTAPQALFQKINACFSFQARFLRNVFKHSVSRVCAPLLVRQSCWLPWWLTAGYPRLCYFKPGFMMLLLNSIKANPEYFLAQ